MCGCNRSRHSRRTLLVSEQRSPDSAPETDNSRGSWNFGRTGKSTSVRENNPLSSCARWKNLSCRCAAIKHGPTVKISVASLTSRYCTRRCMYVGSTYMYFSLLYACMLCNSRVMVEMIHAVNIWKMFANAWPNQSPRFARNLLSCVTFREAIRTPFCSVIRNDCFG